MKPAILGGSGYLIVRHKTHMCHHLSLSKYQGCLLGLAIGDAYGAPYEGGPLEKLLWHLIGKTRSGLRRYTDDTQMAMDLARHLINNGEIKQQELAMEFATNYRWSRGYGPSTIAVLRKIRRGMDWHLAATSKFKDGSFGNGAAMRIPGLALYYANESGCIDSAIEIASSVTHPNKLAIQGAKLLSHTILAVIKKCPIEGIVDELRTINKIDVYETKLRIIEKMLVDQGPLDPNVIRHHLGTSTAATESCSAAIFIGLHFIRRSFSELIDNVIKCRGDTDTVGAMAGSIWGAHNGRGSILKSIPDQSKG